MEGAGVAGEHCRWCNWCGGCSSKVGERSGKYRGSMGFSLFLFDCLIRDPKSKILQRSQPVNLNYLTSLTVRNQSILRAYN